MRSKPAGGRLRSVSATLSSSGSSPWRRNTVRLAARIATPVVDPFARSACRCARSRGPRAGRGSSARPGSACGSASAPARSAPRRGPSARRAARRATARELPRKRQLVVEPREIDAQRRPDDAAAAPRAPRTIAQARRTRPSRSIVQPASATAANSITISDGHEQVAVDDRQAGDADQRRTSATPPTNSASGTRSRVGVSQAASARPASPATATGQLDERLEEVHGRAPGPR